MTKVPTSKERINSMPTECRLLILANSLDPDQAQHSVGQFRARTGSKLFDTLMVFPKEFFKKVVC